MSKPSIGRMVHFWPYREDAASGDVKPFAMTIAFVHSQTMVNLGGWDHNGRHCNATSVPLLRDGETIPRNGFYAAWPQHATAVTDKPGTEPVARVMHPSRPAPVVIDDVSIEAEIQAKGLTAPRVTLDDFNANIVSVEIVKHVAPSGQVLRWAVLTTRSGYAVTGRPSVSVSPENDNAELGEQLARDNARNELWPLMGYELKQRLAANSAGA